MPKFHISVVKNQISMVNQDTGHSVVRDTKELDIKSISELKALFGANFMSKPCWTEQSVELSNEIGQVSDLLLWYMFELADESMSTAYEQMERGAMETYAQNICDRSNVYA